MSVVNSLLKNTVKYTKNGCRLLSKESFTVAGKHKIPVGIKLKNIPICDIVKVETDFGKTLKTITSYKNAQGKVIHKSIVETRNCEEIARTLRDYSYDGAIKVTKTSKFGRGGIHLGESENIFSTSFEVGDREISRGVTRIKFDKQLGANGERLEHQLYETLSPGKGRIRHIETYAKRLNNGVVIDKQLTGSNVNLEQIAQDPYLYIRNYNIEDFTNSARWIAEKSQKVDGLGGQFKLEPMKGKSGYYVNSGSIVAIDAYNPCVTNSSIVDTLNHEFRHKFQHRKGKQFVQRFLNLFRSKDNKVPINTPLSYSIKNTFADIIYPFTTWFQKGYWNNFLEIDARQAGKAGSTIYNAFSENLANIFGGPNRIYKVHDDWFSLAIQDAIANHKTVKLPALSIDILKHQTKH